MRVRKVCPQRLSVYILCALVVAAFGCGGEDKAAVESKAPEHVETKIEKKAVKTSSASLLTKKKGTEISGAIKADKVLSVSESPYVLVGNLEVFPDVKLTIEPGVVIKSSGYNAIVVRGNLQAKGVPGNPIKFVGLRQDDKWDGIQLKDQSFDYNSDDLIEGHGCTIEYCEISEARTAILCEKTSPLIKNNVISNCEEAVKCRNSANPNILNNNMKDNKDGIVCEDYSSPEIKYNTIVGAEGKGLTCRTFSSPTVAYNTIFGTGETWWVGVLCQDSSAPKLNYNNIFANGGFNFKQNQRNVAEKSLAIDAKNNWWGTEDAEAIAKAIYDKQDKADLGEVSYQPFEKVKIPSANHKG